MPAFCPEGFGLMPGGNRDLSLSRTHPMDLQEQDRVRVDLGPRLLNSLSPKWAWPAQALQGEVLGSFSTPSPQLSDLGLLRMPLLARGRKEIWEAFILSLVSKGRGCGSSFHGLSTQCPLAWGQVQLRSLSYRLGQLPNKKTNKLPYEIEKKRNCIVKFVLCGALYSLWPRKRPLWPRSKKG